MDKYCCEAMKRAIEDGYVDWPITYTRDKQMIRLTPIICHREPGHPVFKLNLCPWCGADVRITETKGE